MHTTRCGNGDLALELADSDRNQVFSNVARHNPEGGMDIEGDGNRIVRNRMVGTAAAS